MWAVRRHLDSDAAETSSLAVSEISFWEIATKAAKGKLELDRDVTEWLREASKTPGVAVVEVERETLVRSALLEMPPDPVVRVLVATSLSYGLRLATADEALLRYAERNRLLRVLDMRPDGP